MTGANINRRGEQKMGEVRTVWEGAATLGEGPVWDPARNVLWFVDIKQHKVHCLDPATGSKREWNAPGQIGWVLPAQDGTLLAGLQAGLFRFSPEDGSFTHALDIEPHLATNRLNDAATAPDGCIFFGTMDDGESDCSGRFYRWDGETAAPCGIDPVCITNGPALSPAGTILYHVDTVGGAIHAASLDANGQVTATREFARIDPVDGNPDGCSVDADGNVWIGLWGGGRARLYAPSGDIITEVALPASNVTKVALGGKDLKTAFATTARAGLSEDELAAQPLAGSVFAFEVDVPGLPATPARAIVTTS